MSKDVWTCAICHEKYIGFGHNAEPVATGRCCQVCNDIKVIPFRLKLMRLPVDETIKHFIDAKKRFKNAKTVR